MTNSKPPSIFGYLSFNFEFSPIPRSTARPLHSPSSSPSSSPPLQAWDWGVHPPGYNPNAALIQAFTGRDFLVTLNTRCPRSRAAVLASRSADGFSTPIQQSVKRTPRNPDNHLLRTVSTANGEHLGFTATGASSHTLLPLPLHIPRPTPISSPFSHPHPSSPLYLPLPSHLHLLPFPTLLLYIHRQHALLRQLQVCVSMSMSMFMTPPAGLPPPH